MYSKNRTTGIVTFVTAPGATPISGEDNVRITAHHQVNGYRDRVAKCRFGIQYGVNGKNDRLFVSGNPDYPSQDFFSEQGDYTYFPDTNYSMLGGDKEKISGYAWVDNYLGTFKNEINGNTSLIIREGHVEKNDNGVYTTTFPIVNTMQGDGPVNNRTVQYLNSEPIFLSKRGIFAVTPADVTGRKYSQNRSYYLNGKLLENLDTRYANSITYKDMYILVINSNLYILDGLQPSRPVDSDPYSTRQYSAFYCENVPAITMWTEGDDLCFGTADGKICRFYSDPEDIKSYNDDGYPISAWWETADLDGRLFYKNKTFRYFAMRMMKAFRTSYKLYSQKMSVWSFVKEDLSTGLVFDFERIDFDRFSFSTDWSEKVAHTKLRVKKVDKARFKIENSRLNEPFGLYDLALEYLESGNYKR